MLFYILFLPHFSFSKENVLKISTLEWPPYVISNQKDLGFFCVIVKSILKKIGYESQIEVMPWARALHLVENGSYDGIIPAYYSKERAHYLLYSDPIYYSKIVLFKRKKSNIKFNKLSDLKNYSIGVIRGGVTSEEFDNASYLKKEEAASDERNIVKLCKNRIDLLNGDLEVIKYISSNFYRECYDKIEPLETPLNVQSLSLALNKNVPNAEKIIKNFNIELKKYIEQNEINKIYNKFVPR